MRLNVHKLSVRVAGKEGKKKQVNIAQIKEVIKYTLKDLGKFKNKDIIDTINAYRPKNKKEKYGEWMPFSIVNSRGVKYWLHKTLAKKNKRWLYYFSLSPDGAIDKPQGYEVVEFHRSKIPLLKKIKRWNNVRNYSE